MALLAYLYEFKQNYGPHLIIVPNAVMVNWKAELQTWLPAFRCVYYTGSKDDRAVKFQQVRLFCKADRSWLHTSLPCTVCFRHLPSMMHKHTPPVNDCSSNNNCAALALLVPAGGAIHAVQHPGHNL